MIYRDIDGYYLYQMPPRYSIPKVEIVNTTSPKEYGQKLLNRKRGRKWQSLKLEQDLLFHVAIMDI